MRRPRTLGTLAAWLGLGAALAQVVLAILVGMGAGPRLAMPMNGADGLVICTADGPRVIGIVFDPSEGDTPSSPVRHEHCERCTLTSSATVPIGTGSSWPAAIAAGTARPLRGDAPVVAGSGEARPPIRGPPAAG